ncbi:FkbM family methyltransferase [Thiobacillus sp.]|uniref:FkbM family methyltransferase n=1 Tax=Thiobacillus sp. TaxID=924 RepID=UPI00286DCBB5|nr:FkbM family methyltransferase [Thiobacillus sp.]
MDDYSRADASWRERLFPLSWGLLYPVRLYLCYFPVQRGKGIVLRHILTPLLPPAGAEFDLLVPGEAKVSLSYRETLGLSSLLYGTFEKAELNFVSRYVRQGDTAFDIGANVGIFSVVLGASVGKSGHVAAIEPVFENVARLKKNLAKNDLDNVYVMPLALGASEGRLLLNLAKDAAYHSLGVVEKAFRADGDVFVEVRRLDDVWMEMGRPVVSFVKIDVEGAESDVLRGAEAFLKACCPMLLIEANTKAHLDGLKGRLGALGYAHSHPDGFAPHNHLFYCGASSERLSAAL